jgi:predicted PurR-regulated permease PerM
VVNALFFLILPPFIAQFQLLINIIPNVINKIVEVIEQIDYSKYQDLIPLNFNEIIGRISIFNSNTLSNFFLFFGNFLSLTIQLGLVLFFTIVLLLNPPRYRYYLIKLFPSFYRRRAIEIINKTEVAIVSWLNGILINCIFIGTLSGIGLLILQIKLVLVHALLAGLLNFIPNIGPAASVIFPLLIAVLDAPWKIVAIIIWYFIIQNIESYWLTPRVMAEKVSLLPAVTLFAQIFFARIFGLIGLLLALPLTVVAKTWIEEVLFKDILDQWNQESN